ncbi:uncharacterized protein LOC108951938 [Musa acuminata AAA Group]|uniref:uncharacterized protein LOC108951938 n=1 Tax=Musa acuminata AAA Group TaxID=214697 RepID=UPI0031DD837C
MGGLPKGEASNPLVARWQGLTLCNRVWTDGAASATYARGALIPDIARQLYGSPSEMLIEKAAKSLVWNLHYFTVLMDHVQDAGQIISNLGDRNAELRGQVEELKARAGPEAMASAEQWAVDLEGKVAWLRSELEGTGQQQASLREQPKESRGRVCSMETELLGLPRTLEEVRLWAMKAEEALAEET